MQKKNLFSRNLSKSDYYRQRIYLAAAKVDDASTRLNKTSPLIKYLIGGIIVLLIAIAIAFYAGSRIGGQSASGDQRVAAPEPVATQTLNTTFKFPLRDADGKEVSKVEYTIQKANLQDAFIYQGKLAKAVKGRTFLVLDLKIKNSYDKTIEINAKDYVRVKVNNSPDLLAPEIHNDPVKIQANSTKFTRIGLAINDTDTNVTLLVGELKGSKQTVKLNIKR